jgi:hypothetical protein
MIKVVTIIHETRLMASKTTCRNCNATIEFGCFVPVLCSRCRFQTPNYVSLLDKLTTRIEYYKKGTICGAHVY